MMKRPLMEVEVRHIRDGVTAMQTGEGAIATSTAGNYVAALKDVLDSAIEERLLTSNPARSKAVRRRLRSTTSAMPAIVRHDITVITVSAISTIFRPP